MKNFYTVFKFTCLFNAILLVVWYCDSESSLPERGVCAHRGASYTHPENTIAAFKEAIRLGAHMIEFDVQMSRDSVLVVIHDKTVNRTTNGQGNVVDLSVEELRKLDAGFWKHQKFKGEKIPTLAEALEIMPKNIWLNIHIKGGTEVAKKAAEFIISQNHIHQALLACKPDAAKAVRKADNRIKICNMDRSNNPETYVAVTIDSGFDFIQLTKRAKSRLPELTRDLKKHHIRINYYGTNSPKELLKLFSSGINFPLVDQLEKMLKTAEKLGIKPMSREFSKNSSSTEHRFKELKRFPAKEARQGIAVDEKYIYVVGTRQIGKYNKDTFELVLHWDGKEDGPIIHLDSGVIVNGKLYCAHSNYPGIPMTSSVEIWDAETLQHIGNHSFGIQWGSCTWIDLHGGYWWAAFAQYNKWKAETGKGSEWTTVVKFDDLWRDLGAWVFPKEVVSQFGRMSNSGGSWGSDGLLYCTGHDNAELYAMRIPQMGSILELVEIVPINILGQGIAWDRTVPHTIYGIRKKDRQVVISKLIPN